jgi:pimeloyl-ACP methyl ester carboxylesterase
MLALAPQAAAAGTTTFSGTLADGAAYLVQVPGTWNGTLVLYSHGYVAPGASNPALDVGDPTTGAYLLDQGYALAGTSYSATGWALKEAFQDQIDLLNTFPGITGEPKPARTIAWGHSLGGIITAGLVQLNPDRFTAALPMCGVLSGGISQWNKALDSAYVFWRLVAGGDPKLQVVNLTNPTGNLALAEQYLAAAQATPQGQARIALAAAVGDLPGWFDPAGPEPAAGDYATQELNQFKWNSQVDFPFIFALRAELEARAGGNPSWNTGVDYSDQLQDSADRQEVRGLYKAAGLSLGQDLETLNDSPRIAAAPAAVRYLNRYITFNGHIDIPILTLHTSGDGLVQVTNEQAYGSEVREDGNGRLLRQVYVHRAGHCTFTPAETVAAFKALVNRVNTGHWSGIDPPSLNGVAAGLGALNTAPPAYFTFQPPKDLRPFSD